MEERSNDNYCEEPMRSEAIIIARRFAPRWLLSDDKHYSKLRSPSAPLTMLVAKSSLSQLLLVRSLHFNCLVLPSHHIEIICAAANPSTINSRLGPALDVMRGMLLAKVFIIK